MPRSPSFILAVAAALLSNVSAFVGAPGAALSGRAPLVSHSKHASWTSTSHRRARTVLKAQMDGENLRPDAAAAMEEMAKEASGRIDAMVKENKVMLFMKGNKLFPQCGFSNTAVQILRACDVDFETFDVLSDPDIRQGIKKYSNWPTIPQLFISGEFTGGCDIMVESFQSGELKKMLEEQGAKFME